MRLAHDIVAQPGAEPRRCALLLHGLLGQGVNLQAVARRLVAERPEFAAVLLDLPGHGASRALAARTLREAAALVREACVTAPQPCSAVIGHSFGGKVAMMLLADPPPALRELWVLDASPSARTRRDEGDTTARVIAALRALPDRIASRAEFNDALASRGIDRALALWLAKNLERDGDGFRFGLDLDTIAELFADYDRTDAFALLEDHPADIAVRFVLGGRSESLSDADRARLAALAERGAIALFELPAAGHFVHVDDPVGLHRVLAAHLGR